MASRSHTTFKKRQKEQARQEKRRDKAAQRVQRKLEKQPSDLEEIPVLHGPQTDPEVLQYLEELATDTDSATLAGEDSRE
jgi:hypothetical protein